MIDLSVDMVVAIVTWCWCRIIMTYEMAAVAAADIVGFDNFAVIVIVTLFASISNFVTAGNKSVGLTAGSIESCFDDFDCFDCSIVV